MALFVHDIGVVQLAPQVPQDGVDIGPPEDGLLRLFLLREALRLCLLGQLIDPVNLLLFHSCASRSKMRSISSIKPSPRWEDGKKPT